MDQPTDQKTVDAAHSAARLAAEANAKKVLPDARALIVSALAKVDSIVTYEDVETHKRDALHLLRAAINTLTEA